MKKIKLFAAICLMFIAATLQAQQITPMQLKEARMAVYDWVEDYLVYSYLTDKYDISDYKSLFINQEVMVANDYLPLTTDEQIILASYLALYSDVDAFYTPTIETHKESIHIIDEAIMHDSYICNISIGKTISFADSTRKYCYPPKDYVLNIELQYHFDAKKMWGVGIHTSDILYVDGILHTDDGKNSYISLSDTIELLSNNDHYPAIISSKIKRESFDDKMISLYKDTTKHQFHLGASIGTSLLSYELINNDYIKSVDQPYISWEVNLGLYHQLMLKNNNRLGIEYSLVYRNNRYSFGGEYSTSYNTFDIDGGYYMRQVSVSDYKEDVGLHSISIPVSLRYDKFVHENVTIFGALGLYASFDLYQSINTTAKAEYSGYYDWLYHITINQNGIYDFGTFNLSKSSNMSAFNKFNIGVLAALGVQFFIPHTRWSIEPSIRYQTSLYTPIIHKSDFHLTENESHWQSVTHLFNNVYKHYFQFQININYIF